MMTPSQQRYRPVRPGTTPPKPVGTPPQPPGPPQIGAPPSAPAARPNADALAQFGKAMNREATESEYDAINKAWNDMDYDKFGTWAQATYGKQDPTPPKTNKPPGFPPVTPPGTTPIGNKPPGVTPPGTVQPPGPPQLVTPPTPPQPPAAWKPTITAGQEPTDGSLRGDTYLPGDDARLKAAQSASDRAAGIIQDTHRQPLQSAMEDRYRSIYGTGQIDPSGFGVDTNVRFRGIDPNVAAGAAVDPTESARTASYGTAQDAALQGLDGPSRAELAQQQMDAFDASGQQKVKDLQRQVGQRASALGRLGMGDTEVEATKPYTDYLLARDEKKAQLASQLAEGDINDRFRRLDATSGLRGQEAALDTGRRGEQRTERDYTTNLAENNYGRAANERNLEQALNESNVGRAQDERNTRLGIATGNQDRGFQRTNAALGFAADQTDRNMGDVYNRADAAANLEDRLFNQGQSNRSEYRTERGRQDQQAQQTIENRLREFEIQQQLEDAKIRRAAALAQAGGGY